MCHCANSDCAIAILFACVSIGIIWIVGGVSILLEEFKFNVSKGK